MHPAVAWTCNLTRAYLNWSFNQPSGTSPRDGVQFAGSWPCTHSVLYMHDASYIHTAHHNSRNVHSVGTARLNFDIISDCQPHLRIHQPRSPINFESNAQLHPKYPHLAWGPASPSSGSWVFSRHWHRETLETSSFMPRDSVLVLYSLGHGA